MSLLPVRFRLQQAYQSLIVAQLPDDTLFPGIESEQQVVTQFIENPEQAVSLSVLITADRCRDTMKWNDNSYAEWMRLVTIAVIDKTPVEYVPNMPDYQLISQCLMRLFGSIVNLNTVRVTVPECRAWWIEPDYAIDPGTPAYQYFRAAFQVRARCLESSVLTT